MPTCLIPELFLKKKRPVNALRKFRSFSKLKKKRDLTKKIKKKKFCLDHLQRGTEKYSARPRMDTKINSRFCKVSWVESFLIPPCKIMSFKKDEINTVI